MSVDDETFSVTAAASDEWGSFSFRSGPEYCRELGDAEIAVIVTMSGGVARTAARIGADGVAAIDWEVIERGAGMDGPTEAMVADVCQLLLAAKAGTLKVRRRSHPIELWIFGGACLAGGLLAAAIATFGIGCR